MSGGPFQPTALTTPAQMNATGILIRDVLKRRVLSARRPVTDVCGEVMAIPARLCLKSVVGAACGTRPQRVMDVELAGFSGV